MAKEVAAANASGGFDHYKEAVFNALTNFFTWLSTHQVLAIIIIIGILAIIIYLFAKYRIYRKQTEKKLASQKNEIGKKDALIEEQKSKLVALQTKLADQQSVVSQALIGTITNLTGYSIDQLQTFFKFLTEKSGSPLQRADTQEITMSETQRFEGAGENSAAGTNGDEKTAPSNGPEEAEAADKNVAGSIFVDSPAAGDGCLHNFP